MTLKLPTPVDVSKILELCIGQSPDLQTGGAPLDLADPPAGCYVSWLKNDAGETRGAIVASLPAVAYLGGTMIMIPVGGQEEHVRSGVASEALVDSMAEINNMLRGLFNKLHENEHVSPEDMIPYAPPVPGSDETWILDAAERIDLVGSLPCGEGHLTILGRDG